jgi:hypothetical protein
LEVLNGFTDLPYRCDERLEETRKWLVTSTVRKWNNVTPLSVAFIDTIIKIILMFFRHQCCYIY